MVVTTGRTHCPSVSVPSSPSSSSVCPCVSSAVPSSASVLCLRTPSVRLPGAAVNHAKIWAADNHAEGAEAAHNHVEEGCGHTHRGGRQITIPSGCYNTHHDYDNDGVARTVATSSDRLATDGPPPLVQQEPLATKSCEVAPATAIVAAQLNKQTELRNVIHLASGLRSVL